LGSFSMRCGQSRKSSEKRGGRQRREKNQGTTQAADAVECGCKKCFQTATVTVMLEGEGTGLSEKAKTISPQKITNN
jgi:hypothetical protein